MKLRNKKTGEIVETDYMFGVSIPTTETFGCKSYDQIAAYSSLAELNEEWEDYEEQKGYWSVDSDGKYYAFEVIDDNGKVIARFHKLENLYKKYPATNYRFWGREEMNHET